MKERPILFSGPMVNAILRNEKTQTRRVLKVSDHGYKFEHMMKLDDYFVATFDPGLMFQTELVKCPYGKVGDRLWVREGWRYYIDSELWYCVQYRADNAVKKPDFPDNNAGFRFVGYCDETEDPENQRWRPSIHMPRYSSRILLEIADIRVERVQDISEADAMFEGAEPQIVLPGDEISFVAGFYWLWDSINDKRGFGWDVNPWVWVIEFERRG